MNQKITVRNIHRGDALHILAIRNATDVRQNFRNKDGVSVVEHEQWFTQQLKPENRKRFFVAMIGRDLAGYLRYDLKNDHFDISIAVMNTFRKSGVGKALLKLSLPKIRQEHKPIKAEVRKTNFASLLFFEKNGFVRSSEDEEYVSFVLPSFQKPIVIATRHLWDSKRLQEFKKHACRKVILLEKKRDLDMRRLRQIDPAYIFFPHWSWIIPEGIWKKFRCVVFHMTDLPYGRGGSPLQNLIVRGISKTMISALAVDGTIDGGPVYLKRELSLSGNAQQIYRRAFRTILLMIEEIVERNPVPRKQEGKVIAFRRRTPDQSRIPTEGSLTQLYDFIRMLDANGYPKAFLDHGDFLLSFSKTKIHANEISAYVTIQKKIHEKN